MSIESLRGTMKPISNEKELDVVFFLERQLSSIEVAQVV